MDLQTPESFLNIESRDDAVIARFACQIMLGGQIAVAVSEKLMSLLPELGQRRLLVDFGNVRSLTSLMLGKLVQLNNTAQSVGTRMIIFNMTPNVRKTVEVTRLDLILTILDDEAAAVNASVTVEREPRTR